MRHLFLNSFVIFILSPICLASDLSEAIDNPELTITQGGYGDIIAQSETTHDGVDAIELSTIANQNEFWFQTTIEGPATVSFYYRFEPDRISNWAKFYIDGIQKMRDHFGHYNGTRDGFNWTLHEYEILTEGSHTLRWAVNHSYYVDDDTKAWVDELVVDRAPIIKAQPTPVNVDEGEPVELSVEVNLPEKVIYQWRQNGIPIPEATSSSLTIESAQPSTVGVYDVAVSNAYGTTESTPVDVFVFSQFGAAIEQPDFEWRTSGIGWSPQSAVSHDGVDSLELDSRDTPKAIWFETSINGPFSLSYWWKLENEQLQDKVELAINGTPVALYDGNGDWAMAEYETLQVGSHDVRWTFTPDPSTDKDYNTFGWVDELNIEYVPSIVTSPQDIAVDAGGPIVLEVTAVAETAIEYQWYRNGVALAGETNAQLNIASASVDDGGSYHVVASTESRSAESDPATVLVLAGFSDAVELSDITWDRSVPSWYAQTDVAHDNIDALEAVLDNDSAEPTFEFQIQGPFELSFWWRQSEESWASGIRFLVDGVVTSEKRNDSSWSQVKFAGLESRSYTLGWQYKRHQPSDSFARAYLDEFQISRGPIITDQPESWYYAEGEDASFSVQAVAQSAIAYQWRKNGVDIEGATSPSLTLNDVLASAIGEYDVVLTSSEGSTVSDAFEIMEATALGAAVEQPHLIWKTNGDEQWLIDSFETDGSESSLRSGNISGNGTTWISTVVEGDSELTFNWKASTEACCDRLKLYIDGELTGELRGEEDWTQFSHTIPAGLHELKWVYIKDETDNAGQDSVWIDSVQLNPIVTDLSSDLSLFEGQELQLAVSVAGDFELSYSWSKDGDPLQGETASSLSKTGILRDESGEYRVLIASDFGQVLSEPISVQVVDFGAPIGQADQKWKFSDPTWSLDENFQDRSVAIASGLVAIEGERWFELEIEGSATLTFEWVLSSDDGDELKVIIDDIQQALPIDAENWSSVQFEAPGGGTHSLRWSFVENELESGESDYAAIDSIEIDQTPQILSQPHQIVMQEGQELELTVEVEAVGTLSYQWYLNDVLIPDATTSTFTANSATQDNSGTYHLAVSTKHETVSTDPISVIVSEPLSSGLDAEEVELTPGVPQRWYTDKEFSHDGEDSISVVPLAPGETAEFSIKHTGPFYLSYDYWIGSDEDTSPELVVRIDENHEIRFTRSNNWKSAEITYPAQGEHEISISVTHEADALSTPKVWIDKLQIDAQNAVEMNSAIWTLEAGGDRANLTNIGSIQDPDLDGLTNLFEFWLQSDPFGFSDIIEFEILRTEDKVIARFGIEIPEQQTDAFDLVVQASSDLEIWKTIETTSTYLDGTLSISVDDEDFESNKFFRFVGRDINQ